MPKYFVRFPDAATRLDSARMLNANPERYRPFFPTSRRPTSPVTAITDLSDEERRIAEANGCKVFVDIQFHPVSNALEFRLGSGQYWRSDANAPANAEWLGKSLTDVLSHIKAPEAWHSSRGAGVTIGIVDSGIAGAAYEFPANKQSLLSQSYAYSAPWVDTVGHGTMCACAAAAKLGEGARFNGVAPDATIMSLRTSFASTDIYQLYEWVIQKKQAGGFDGPVVLSNSYGQYACAAPVEFPSDHPYLEIIREAVADGITVVFAAGNNHVTLCNFGPGESSPNTIWGAASVDEVLSIGTVNWDNRLDVGAHANSSRGPGQWAVATTKPDCVAPTYGEILVGEQYRSMEWWGTSGAAPLVAGLAALLLSKNPALTPKQVYNAIRAACDAIPNQQSSSFGTGVINCKAAVESV